MSLAFATDSGPREGWLTITPGAAGINLFTVTIDGAALPEGTESVLRFALLGRDIGAQELRLEPEGANQFRAEGGELALPGDWEIETIVRRIGEFSWATSGTLPVGAAPPPTPEASPAPVFAPAAVPAMIAMAIGIAALAVAMVARRARSTRRGALAATGALVFAAGVGILSMSRIPAADTLTAPVIAYAEPASEAAPATAASPESMEMEHHHQAMAAATPRSLPGPGTPAAGDGLTVTIAAAPEQAGPVEVVAEIADEAGNPLSEARVVVLSDMPAMEMGRVETPAEEIAPGRYVATFVPLGMAGEWQVTVRVSPRGEPTKSFPFTVTVPS
jgi:hypothetical protein